MKTTCIIPDLHLKWELANQIIKAAGADEYIFLGDCFDDFGDSPESLNEMIDWLESAVKNANYTFLFGNHDMQYAFPEEHWRCSGYAQWKHFIVRDRLSTKWFEQHFKYYHVLDEKWLLSHGGLHQLNVPEEIKVLYIDRPKFLRKLADYLDFEIIKGHRNQSWIFHAGHGRGGSQRVGGIDWCDFTREFYPIKGLNQIVGHTPQMGVARWLHMDSTGECRYHPADIWEPKKFDFDSVNESLNLCLDVHANTHWAIWNGKEIKLFNLIENL